MKSRALSKYGDKMKFRTLSILSAVFVLVLWQFVVSPAFKTYFLPAPSAILMGAVELLFVKKTLLAYLSLIHI